MNTTKRSAESTEQELAMTSTHACARTRKPSLCLPGNERLVEGEFVRPRRIIDRLAREAENEQLLPLGDERLGQPLGASNSGKLQNQHCRSEEIRWPA